MQKYQKSCALWHVPIIPALWEVGGSFDRSLKLTWQRSKTPSLQKIEKLAECGGMRLYIQLLGRPRWEDGLSQEFETSLGNMARPHLYKK